jgi:phosphomannomutase / phosphoglucomutase
VTLPSEIFKAYDIRGVVGRTLTPHIVASIGRALGSLALERDRHTSVVRHRERDNADVLLRRA